MIRNNVNELHCIFEWLKQKLAVIQYGEIVIRFFVHQGKVVKCEKTVTEREKT